jgi:hypothetical protein
MLLFGQRFHHWWLYLGLARNWLGTPETCDDFNPEISDTISGAFAAEYLWSDRLSLLGQVEGSSTPFSDTGIRALDRDFFALTLGAKYRLSNAFGVQFAFSEDLSPAASDFTVRAGLVIDF